MIDEATNPLMDPELIAENYKAAKPRFNPDFEGKVVVVGTPYPTGLWQQLDDRPGIGGETFKLKINRDWMGKGLNLDMLKDALTKYFYSKLYPEIVRLQTGKAGLRMILIMKKNHQTVNRLTSYGKKRILKEARNRHRRELGLAWMPYGRFKAWSAGYRAALDRLRKVNAEVSAGNGQAV